MGPIMGELWAGMVGEPAIRIDMAEEAVATPELIGVRRILAIIAIRNFSIRGTSIIILLFAQRGPENTVDRHADWPIHKIIRTLKT